MIGVDEKELENFHDLEWCPDCEVMICHSCSPDVCSLIKEEAEYDTL